MSAILVFCHLAVLARLPCLLMLVLTLLNILTCSERYRLEHVIVLRECARFVGVHTVTGTKGKLLVIRR